MSKNQSTDEIERDIEGERVALARAVEELQRQLSPDAIAIQALSVLRSNSGDMVGSIVRQARENPLALAVTGAGLAWLITGPAARSNATVGSPDPKVDYDRSEHPKAPGLRRSTPDESFETRVGHAHKESHSYDPTIRADPEQSSETETNTAPGDCSLRDRLMEGTEMMTDAARDRVIAAREAAIAAERRLEAQARDYGSAGKDAFEGHPLMGALVAFGVGALAGALLPRTRVEDRNLGAARDHAQKEAESVYRAEAAKLRARMEETAADGITAVSDPHRNQADEKTGKADHDESKGTTVN
ncbi:DUF3618 domain-containing protein [Jannaschia faecimaris]|nr:DUF3618 domain-containing protein [Jannaschia faecimaris]